MPMLQRLAPELLRYSGKDDHTFDLSALKDIWSRFQAAGGGGFGGTGMTLPKFRRFMVRAVALPCLHVRA